jgi:hypothetical protein
MTLLEEFVARALVGVQRQQGTLPSLPADLGEFADKTGPVETALLDGTAAWTLYSACGATAGLTADRPIRCPADETPECSPAAAHLLDQLLESPLNPILEEWLRAAAAARRRPPHRLLPTLLDRAAERKELREPVHAVIDRRGEWLATLNPKWQFAQSAPADSEAAWQTGTRDERLAALRATRDADPAQARRWVEETWTADAADDRVRWLGTFSAGLSMKDEPFLETCLDDRSSRVREAAADLLARLPDSRLVGRMTARLDPLVSFIPAKAGLVLKLQAKRPAFLVVTLPAEFDKAMLRDGMTEKPAVKIGVKQWWLTQMLAGVPPKHWSARFETTAADLVAALDPEFSDAVVTGWRVATVRTPDPAWAAALARTPAGADRWSAKYLTAVAESDRPGVLAELASADPAAVELDSLLAAWGPVSEPVSRAVVAKFTPDQLLAASAATRLHPVVLADLEPGLTELAAQTSVGRAANEALSTITLRRAIHREFAR